MAFKYAAIFFTFLLISWWRYRSSSWHNHIFNTTPTTRRAPHAPHAIIGTSRFISNGRLIVFIGKKHNNIRRFTNRVRPKYRKSLII